MVIIKCKYCNKEKTEKDFGIFRGRRNKGCIECRKYHNEYYAHNSKPVREKAKEFYKENKEAFQKRHRTDHLKRLYKISVEDYNKMLTKQDNVCAICENKFTEKNLPCVDHCHRTNKVRGLLCRKCNLHLFYIEDEKFIQKAKIYLRVNEV